MKTRFEWDSAKAESNLKKHRVRFEIATRVFADPLALARQDRVEDGEHRWQTIGNVSGYLLLVVAHTTWDEADGTEVIRIISARRADPKERQHYEHNSSL